MCQEEEEEEESKELIIDDDCLTEVSYYVPIEDVYNETMMKKQQELLEKEGDGESGDDTIGDKSDIMNMLSDKQYILMADSLGILDISKIDDNFSMTREEALDRIN